MRISECLEQLELKIKGAKIKSDEDEVEPHEYETVYIDLMLYNHSGVKNVAIVEAVKNIDGVSSVDII